MSNNSKKEQIFTLKEWLGSERTKNLFKSIKVYTTNYKPTKKPNLNINHLKLSLCIR